MKPLPFKMNTDTAITKYRHDSFWDKEPETIEWINNMPLQSILIDVGANVGMYSLYAASRGIFVIAIEPMISNFHELCRNMILNGYQNIVPVFAAAGAIHGIDRMTVSDIRPGATGAQANGTGEAAYLIPSLRLERLLSIFSGKISVKIDIDGQELKVLAGMGDNIHKIDSLLIEVDHKQTDVKSVDNLMAESGLFRDTVLMRLPNHSSNRRGGNPENIIYWRA